MFICRFLKGVVFFVLLVGGAVFVSSIVFGKDRVKGLFSSVKASIQSQADAFIDERAQLERELEELSASYPERIADIRSTLREAETQAAYIEDEHQRRHAVIELCNADIAELSDLLDDSNATDLSSPMTVSFRGLLYTTGEAENLLDKALRTREVYLEHYNQLAVELQIVEDHIDALRVELEKMRSEQQSFEVERDSIRREIERIEHNEKLIELGKRRSSSSYDDDQTKLSLEKMRTKLERKRTKQEEELKALKVRPEVFDYEARARLMRMP